MPKPGPTDVLRYPLNRILGSEANVRLLRVLVADTEAPLSAPDASALAGLTPAGGRLALARLTRSGFIVCTGSGRGRQYRLRTEEPLATTLRLLFQEERERYDALVHALRDILGGIREVRAAWIRSMPRRFEDSLEIVVIADARSLSWLPDEVRTRIAPLESSYDQVIEVSTLTEADAPFADTGATITLAGTPAEAGSARLPAVQSPAEREERSLRLSRAVVNLLEVSPDLRSRAIRHLDRLIREDQGTATSDLDEWRRILQTYSRERLRDFLVSSSSRAERLRRSSPFLAVLTPEERDELLGDLETRS